MVSRTARWGRAAGIALLFAIGPAQTGRAEPRSPEYEVKAAFLYNFARFVDWPTSALARGGDAFVVGILGADPFGSTLDHALASKTLLGRPIEVRRLRSIDAALDCHLVFLSRSETLALPVVLRQLRDRGILTVGDTVDMAERGCVVGFAVIDERVRFAVNPRAAEAAGLRLSSQLLKVAIVIDQP